MSSATARVRSEADFKFKKLRSLKVFDELGNVADKSPNLLAVSNKYGLVFVGTAKSIKVIRTDAIEQLDGDGSLAKVLATEYPFQEVTLSSDLIDLALRCDSLVLAACVLQDGLPHVYMYDVAASMEKSLQNVPFTGVQLASTRDSSLLEFLWNPSIPSMFATCLSDGSVCVYDMSDGTPQINASLPIETAATAICWSPKGKQLVVGKRDGTLTQHTPDLKVAKTVPPPYIYENEVAVVSIAWLSSYQFAVVYQVEGRPCLVIVNAPKSAKPTFVDFDDVCFGASEQRPLRYYMLHILNIRMLVCSSSNALDVAVLSNKEGDGSVWEQWMLEDDGRADLPLMGDDETYPLGMALNLTAQQQVLVDTNYVPPKPILHILSTGGCLLSYRLFGEDPTMQSMMKPPEALPAAGPQRQQPHPNQSASLAFGSVPQPAAPKETVTAFAKPTSGVSFAVSSAAVSTSFSMPVATTGSSYVGQAARSGAAFAVPTTTSSALPSSSLFGSNASGKPVVSGSITTGTPLFGSVFGKPTQNHSSTLIQPASSGVVSSAFAPTATIASKSTFAPTSTFSNPSLTATNSWGSTKSGLAGFTNLTGKRSQADSSAKSVPTPAPPMSKSDKEAPLKARPVRRTQGQTALVSVLQEELSKFDVEVQQAKKRTTVLAENITTEKEEHIKMEIQQLENFLQEAKSATRSMNAELHVLRANILDGFTALEEGRSLESRSKDKRFVHLLKTRSLDPMSAKRMKDIRPMFFYLETQLQQVNLVLDKLWDDFQRVEKKSLEVGPGVPTLELIYRTMTVNHEIAFNMRQSIDRLTADISRIQSSGHRSFRMLSPGSESAGTDLTPAMRKMKLTMSRQSGAIAKKAARGLSNDLSSLSDMMLNVTVDSHDYSPSPFATPKTLSKTTRGQLRNILESRPVTHVRPATPVEEYSQLISPNFTVRDFLQERDSEERERFSTQVISPERASSGDSTRPATEAVTPPTFKPFFTSHLSGDFVASQPLVSIQPRSATSGATSSVSSLLPPAVAPVSSAFPAANIFTLAASTSKNAKGVEQPKDLKIGGIPLETVNRDAPTDLSTHKSPPNQGQSPILMSLLLGKRESSSSGTTAASSGANVGASYPFSFAGTTVTDLGPTTILSSASGNKVAPSISLTKPTTSPFAFSAATPTYPRMPFGNLPPFDFPRSNLFGDAAGSNEGADKSKLSSVYEDVSPPVSPRAYVAEEGYLVEEPDIGEEEEYEEEETQEDEDGERDEDYEDQEAWEDEDGETANTAEYTPVENIGLQEQEAVSTPTTNDKAADQKEKTGADEGARDDTSPAPKSTVDIPILAPIFKVPFSNSSAASTPTNPDAAAPSTDAAPVITVSEPALSTVTQTSIGAGATGTTAVFTNSETPDTKSPSAVAPTQSVVPPSSTASSFRFALPAGTTATTVTSHEKSPASAFSFTMPTASSSSSTFAASAGSQSLFGSKLSFGASDGSSALNLSGAPASIFGGSKPAAPFGTQPSGAAAFSFGQPGSSAFGTTTTTTSSGFGQTQSTVFGQAPSNTSSAFGQQISGATATTSSSTGGGNLFSQGSTSLFGGLGAKPNPENVNKNIFGSPSTFGAATQTTSLFGSPSPPDSSIGWNKPASGGASSGGFAGSGFASGGSVIQSGFGFQQSSPKPAGFGGAPGFGSPPTFGGAPTFGSVGQMGSRLFGSPTAQPTGFGSFAAVASDAPTFGSLASQPSAMTFNAIASQQPASPFGAPSTPNPPAFGAAPSFGAPAFGAQAQMNSSPFGTAPASAQPSVFGSPPAFGSTPSAFGAQPQQQTQGSPSFSQWR